MLLPVAAQSVSWRMPLWWAHAATSRCTVLLLGGMLALHVAVA